MNRIENILFGKLAIHSYLVLICAHLVKLLVAQLAFAIRPDEHQGLSRTLRDLMLLILGLYC